ncbi:MAG: mechanosensitive ion channel [Gammaproteobacteria bacterium]|nr:mechanosensitive ion channel [Gammaproteobacteria bacterium]MBU0785580.1 mechanosensitive ion channel [Gammaproteobacteria bacterium]MBU0816868.1 mechanosensitive ion channel [Gammaproteobacteria bacterium]MBU1787032.1 mechanosensitive ion channel [Gammaproteobacteria bacterium]
MMGPDSLLTEINDMASRLFNIGGTRISLAGLLMAMVFVVGIWWFAGMLERSVHRLARRYADEPWKFARIHLLSRLMRYGVWVLGTVIGLNYIGIDLTSIALLGSALAVGLGFGLQNVFSNFVSGVIILLERSLKVGDFVDLESGVRGHVREIAMRYTRVTTNDSLDVLVPNSEFINGRVVNWTLDDAHRRMHIPFGVAYGTPKELVREAGIEAARNVKGVVENDRMSTAVWLIKYGDNSMDYELIVWADRALTTRPASTHASLMWALDDALKVRGIEIPFPQRDLHIRSGTLDVRMAREAGDAAGPVNT